MGPRMTSSIVQYKPYATRRMSDDRYMISEWFVTLVTSAVGRAFNIFCRRPSSFDTRSWIGTTVLDTRTVKISEYL
jgi:hypothetical protein